MVDNSGPEVFSRFSIIPKGNSIVNDKNIVSYPSHVGLFIAATDKESGYGRMVYSLNGSKEKVFTGYLENFSKNDNNVTIKAYDKLGNETVSTLEFAIKN